MSYKILFTASTWSHIDYFHTPYLRYFADHGIAVHLGCPDAPKDLAFVSRVIDLPFKKQMSLVKNADVIKILRKEIKNEHYDLIITHTSLAAFFTRLALFGRTRKHRPPVINMVHGYLFDYDSPALKQTVLLNAERFMKPYTDLLLVMNDFDYELAKTNLLCTQIERVPGIGVNFEKLSGDTEELSNELKKKWNIPADAFVIIYPAEFSKRKSQAVLIRTLPLLSENVILVLAGDGDLREECEALAESLNVRNRVIFPKTVADMRPWYSLSDILVTTSRSEGLPFNVMEGMYMGLPVIASEVKGHIDLIDLGHSGLLYPYGDESALASQIRILQDSEELRRDFANRAHNRVLQYDLKLVFPVVMEQYASIIRKTIPDFFTEDQPVPAQDTTE